MPLKLLPHSCSSGTWSKPSRESDKDTCAPSCLEQRVERPAEMVWAALGQMEQGPFLVPGCQHCHWDTVGWGGTPGSGTFPPTCCRACDCPMAVAWSWRAEGGWREAGGARRCGQLCWSVWLQPCVCRLCACAGAWLRGGAGSVMRSHIFSSGDPQAGREQRSWGRVDAPQASARSRDKPAPLKEKPLSGS